MPLHPQWFVQRAHYRFSIIYTPIQEEWLIRENDRRLLAPDYAIQIGSLGGKRREQEGTEYWSFPRSQFAETSLLEALAQAVQEADKQREVLAELVETRQLTFETQVRPSAFPGQWVVTLLAPLPGMADLLIPIRLPKAEQGNHVIPLFARQRDAQAYAAQLQRTYAPL